MEPMYDVVVVPDDGNAFSVMSAVSRALRKKGATDSEVEQYLADSMSGDYDNLLRVAMKWVKLEA